MNFPIRRNRGGASQRGRALARVSQYRGIREQRLVTKADLDALTRGEAFRPPLTPSLFSASPWFGLTVRIHTAISVKAFTVKDIAELGLKQSGLLGKQGSTIVLPDTEWRILAVSAWNFNGATISLYPYDFYNNEKKEMRVISCSAQRNMFAAVGFRWPESVSAKSHVINSTNTVFAISNSGSQSTEIHVKCLFKGGDPASPLLDDTQHLVVSSVVRDNMAKVTASSRALELARLRGQVLQEIIAEAEISSELEELTIVEHGECSISAGSDPDLPTTSKE